MLLYSNTQAPLFLYCKPKQAPLFLYCKPKQAPLFFYSIPKHTMWTLTFKTTCCSDAIEPLPGPAFVFANCCRWWVTARNHDTAMEPLASDIISLFFQEDISSGQGKVLELWPVFARGMAVQFPPPPPRRIPINERKPAPSGGCPAAALCRYRAWLIQGVATTGAARRSPFASLASSGTAPRPAAATTTKINIGRQIPRAAGVWRPRWRRVMINDGDTRRELS